MQTLNCIPRELINNLNKVQRAQILRSSEQGHRKQLAIPHILNIIKGGKNLAYRRSGTLCSPKRSLVNYTDCSAKLVARPEEAIKGVFQPFLWRY